MPTNRTRRTRRRRATVLTGRQIEHLLWGCCLAACPGPDIHFPFDSPEQRRDLWFEHREYLLSLEGQARVPGVFGHTPLKKGERLQAMLDYEGKKRT